MPSPTISTTRNGCASTALSFEVAALAVIVGCITGSLAAVALHGRRFRGRGLVAGVILAPIVVPLVVLALGDYLLLAQLHMIGGWATIGLVHGMLVTPYIFLSVQTSLAAELDPALIRSARSLGAGPLSVMRHVYWPAIRPGLLAGSVLGFAVSFDEVVIALFLQGPTRRRCRSACSPASSTSSRRRSRRAPRCSRCLAGSRC